MRTQASQIELDYLKNLWSHQPDRRMDIVCPNCLAHRAGSVIDTPHASWCAIWRETQEREQKAESRTVRFHFEQKGFNAHTADGLFTYDTPEHAQDAQAVLKACEDDYKAYQEKDRHNFKPLTVKLPIANRNEDIYTGTWKGYFERLRELRIETLGGGMSVKF